MNCIQLVQWEDELGFIQYSKCNRPAKHRVKFKTLRGEDKDYLLCGIHLNSLKAWGKRVLKLTDNKIGIEIIEITNKTN